MTYTHRHLPHWAPPGQDIFITWRLQGSLPPKFRPPASVESNGKAFVIYDRILDQGRTGPLWLNNSRIANSVLMAFKAAQHRKMIALRAYVLMANHVHVLLAPLSPIAQITHQIKGATAREANLLLSRTGSRFWQNESFDHWIRNPEEWQSVRAYIERNPVSAGLVNKPEDWVWSSASHPIE
jgi:REP element-mobilizing transposase RayT